MDFVGNLLLFAAVKAFCKSIKNGKVIAMVRVAPFFDSRCIVPKSTDESRAHYSPDHAQDRRLVCRCPL